MPLPGSFQLHANTPVTSTSLAIWGDHSGQKVTQLQNLGAMQQGTFQVKQYPIARQQDAARNNA